MPISFRGTPQSGATDGGAVAISLTGVQAGDLLVAIGANDFYTAASLQPPTGAPGDPTWTERATGDAGTNASHIRVWTAVAAQAGAHDLTLPAPDDSGRLFAAAALVDADPSQIDAAGNQGTNSANHVAPSVVSPSNDAMLITGHTCRANVGSAINYTAPTGMTVMATERDIIGANYSATLGNFSQQINASGATGTRTAVASATRSSWATISIVIGAVAQAVNVAPDDDQHGHAADEPTLTQTHELDSDEASHGHTAAEPTLVQVHVLSVDSASHGQASSSPDVAQTHVVAAGSATHGHAADSPALTQAHVLAGDDARHQHTATEPVLAQVHQLAPDDARHTHDAAAPLLTQAHSLAADDATHGHTTSEPALTQLHQVGAHDATHGHTAGQPDLTQGQMVAANGAAHTHTVTEPALGQVHQLAPVGATHEQVAAQPSLTQTHQLPAADATHTHVSGMPALASTAALVVDPAIHAHAAAQAALTQLHQLVVQDAIHGQVAGGATVTTPTGPVPVLGPATVYSTTVSSATSSTTGAIGVRSTTAEVIVR